jgi:hypothetical protein
VGTIEVNSTMRRSDQEVADFIENHVHGTEGPHDWDDFTSIPISDRRLNAIRLRCVQLDDEHPDDRRAELRSIVQDLRKEK